MVGAEAELDLCPAQGPSRSRGSPSTAPFSQPSLSAEPPESPSVTALHFESGELRPRECRPGRLRRAALPRCRPEVLDSLSLCKDPGSALCWSWGRHDRLQGERLDAMHLHRAALARCRCSCYSSVEPGVLGSEPLSTSPEGSSGAQTGGDSERDRDCSGDGAPGTQGGLLRGGQ